MSLESLNIAWFNLINAPAEASHRMIHIATFIANDLIYFLMAFLIISWLYGDYARKELALKSVVIAFIALGVAQIITAIYPHPRPFMIPIGRTYVVHAPDASFPSDHMTLFSSIAFTFWFARYYLSGLLIFVAGLLVAWSRVYLGVHFPFDMLGSVILSVIMVWSLQPLWQKFGDPLANACIRIYRQLFKLPISLGLIK